MCLATVCLHGPRLCARYFAPVHGRVFACWCVRVCRPSALSFYGPRGAGRALREAHVRGGEKGRGNMRAQLEGKRNSGDRGFTKF